MKDTDYHKLVDLVYMGGGFVAANKTAEELQSGLVKGEVLSFLHKTPRDLKYHRCYFALLKMVYGYLPPNFKSKVPIEGFYKFLKHLKGDYKVIHTFKDGSELKEYDSISFGMMNQREFQNYVSEQLPFIYSNVIGAFFNGEIYDNIVATIEKDFQKFLETTLR